MSAIRDLALIMLNNIHLLEGVLMEVSADKESKNAFTECYYYSHKRCDKDTRILKLTYKMSAKAIT